jgi:hypothetical protein
VRTRKRRWVAVLMTRRTLLPTAQAISLGFSSYLRGEVGGTSRSKRSVNLRRVDRLFLALVNGVVNNAESFQDSHDSLPRVRVTCGRRLGVDAGCSDARCYFTSRELDFSE